MPRYSIGFSDDDADEDDTAGPSSRPRKLLRTYLSDHFEDPQFGQPEDEDLVEEDVQSEHQDYEGEEENDEEEEEEEEDEEVVSEEENVQEQEEVQVEEDCGEDLTTTSTTTNAVNQLLSLNGGGGRKRKERDTVDGPISVTLTDPDVLDCPICLEPLTSPVFQCENGHTACSCCCSKIRNKCPSCCLPIGYNRCRAIEKVLESIKVSCRNMKFGCKEAVSFGKKHEHEQACIHEPCSCPHPGCNFVASSKRLYMHFTRKHPNSATVFCRGCIFTVTVKMDMKFVILQEPVDCTLFILNYGAQSIGKVASITCIAPSSSQRGYTYELVARKGASSVKLESFAESMPRWSEHLPQKAFLLVPNDFIGSSRVQSFHICIKRHKEVPDGTPIT